MDTPTPATRLDAATKTAEQHGQRDAHLDEAKAVLLDALAKLGIVRVEAEVTLAGDKPILEAITAYTDGQVVRDLADTAAVDFTWGVNHQSYANLLQFARDYLSSVLAHQPAEHLTSGTIYVWVATCAVVQPIDYAARDAVENAAKLERLRDDKANIIAALKAQGVVLVEAEYDGEGDSGQINDIAAYKADNSTLDLTKIGPIALGDDDQDARSYNTLHELLDEFAWEVLWHHHEGFENNDGGFGKVVIDVELLTVRLEHNWRISSSEYTEAEF